MRYRFGDYEVDEEAFELRRSGKRVEIEPKPLKLLIHLLSRYPAAPSRIELLDSIWPDAQVTDNALSRAVRIVRGALGEAGRSGDVLQTVRGVGFRIGVPVQVLGDAAESGSLAGNEAPPDAGAMVGREAELERGRAALRESLAGQSQLLLISGEPGIGKTRLAQAIAAEAAADGMRVLWGRAYDGEGAPAFWPWLQVFRTHVDQSDSVTLQRELGEEAAAIAEIVPELASRVRRPVDSAELDPAEARFRFFDSVTIFLRRVSTSGPLVIVLDDLHWADEPTLLLLEFLAREIAPAPVLLIGTRRDTEVSSGALERILEAAARQEHGGGCLTLHPLDRGAVDLLVHETLADEPTELELDAIFDRSEGNPFFVQELARLLPAESCPSSTRAADAASRLPPGLKQVLQRRLEALPEPSVELLRLGSVIGREFSMTVLADVAGTSLDNVLDHLEAAEEARILTPLGNAGGLARFSHALMRDALYDRLSGRQRIRHHHAVAQSLERLHAAAPEPHVGEIASHFLAALPRADPSAVVDYTTRAARFEAGRLAFEESVNHCERGLEVVETHLPANTHARCDLLELKAEGLFHCGDREGASKCFWALCESARAAGDGEQLARAAMGLTLGQLFTADSHPRVVSVIEEALVLLPAGDGAARAKLLACLSRQLTWSERYEEREAHSREAVAMARRIGEPNELIEVLGAHACLLEAVGDDDERAAVIDELEALAQRQRIRVDIAAAQMYRTQLMAELARSDAFDRELARYDALTAEIRHPHHIAFVARFHAMRALWRGRVGEAERLVFDAYEKGQRSDPSYAFAAFSAQLGLLRRLQGRFVELEAPLLQSAERYPVMVSFRSALALLYAMDGRREEASEGFASLAANDFAALLPNDPNHRLNLALLTEVCAALGEREAAQSLAKSLAAYRGRYIAVSTVIAAGCGSRYLGLLAATCGDYDSAEKLFVEAIALEVRMHADAWLANTQCDYARMLLERRKSGDVQRAEQLLDDAGRLSSSNELEGLQRTITQIRASSF